MIPLSHRSSSRLPLRSIASSSPSSLRPSPLQQSPLPPPRAAPLLAKTLHTNTRAAAIKKCPALGFRTPKILRDTIDSQRLQFIARHLSSTNSPPHQSPNMSWDKQQGSGFSARRIGTPNTLDYRVYIEQNGTPISPFHDVPLYANEQQTILNMIVEIPRWTNAKLEV